MDNIKYTIIRFNNEILFLPSIVDYGSTYNDAEIIAFDINEEKFQELVEFRNDTPQDKIFDLDFTLKPFYRERYTDEEKRKIKFENAINYYQTELKIANKFFQEYNLGLNGTQEDMQAVKEYLKAIRLTENDYEKFNPEDVFIRPAILYQYD